MGQLSDGSALLPTHTLTLFVPSMLVYALILSPFVLTVSARSGFGSSNRRRVGGGVIAGIIIGM